MTVFVWAQICLTILVRSQGIFPAKRMTEAMSGVLPAKQPDHPSIEKQPEAIKTTTPRSRPAQ